MLNPHRKKPGLSTIYLPSKMENSRKPTINHQSPITENG